MILYVATVSIKNWSERETGRKGRWERLSFTFSEMCLQITLNLLKTKNPNEKIKIDECYHSEVAMCDSQMGREDKRSRKRSFVHQREQALRFPLVKTHILKTDLRFFSKRERRQLLEPLGSPWARKASEAQPAPQVCGDTWTRASSPSSLGTHACMNCTQVFTPWDSSCKYRPTSHSAKSPTLSLSSPVSSDPLLEVPRNPFLLS